MGSSRHRKSGKNSVNPGSRRGGAQKSMAKPTVMDSVTAITHLQTVTQLLAHGRVEEAWHMAASCIEGTKDKPGIQTEAKRLAAIVLMKKGLAEDAIPLLQDARNFRPDDIDILNTLGAALFQASQYVEAETCFRRVLSASPRHIDAQYSLGHALYKQDKTAEAYGAYHRTLELNPQSFAALQSILFMQFYQYPVDMDGQHENILRVQNFFRSRAADPVWPVRDLHTPLIVGFVSGDLSRHPVGYFLDGMLSWLKQDFSTKGGLELIAYHTRAGADDFSERLKLSFDTWHQVEEWSDSKLVNQIKTDRIDILIDLSGHTHGNRLAVFAQKPAPIQISWLGYWASTGLSTMDYVLADPVSLPEGEEKWFVEKIWRLPHLRYCFSAPEGDHPVLPPPCMQNAGVVFGSYPVLQKINRGVLCCWAQILTASPQARLRIQSKDLSQPSVEMMFVQRLREAGIDMDRVELVTGMDRAEYLASYGKVDIVLDTFPYTGGTTTAEALWMGVPTLTLAMPGMLGRQGEALMVGAGLSDWVVRTEAEYVERAIVWGNADVIKRTQLAEIRGHLRESLKSSPVFDARSFARDFVDALHTIWQNGA